MTQSSSGLFPSVIPSRPRCGIGDYRPGLGSPKQTFSARSGNHYVHLHSQELCCLALPKKAQMKCIIHLEAHLHHAQQIWTPLQTYPDPSETLLSSSWKHDLTYPKNHAAWQKNLCASSKIMRFVAISFPRGQVMNVRSVSLSRGATVKNDDRPISSLMESSFVSFVHSS